MNLFRMPGSYLRKIGICSLIITISIGCFSWNTVKGDPIRVVVWDEQQPRQAEAYDDFLGNEIAAYLRQFDDLRVVTKRLDDPGKGIDAETINHCDVLIWWGHARNGEVSLEESKPIVKRIKEGKLSLIALHSSHWASPFMEAMNERTRLDAAAKYPNSSEYPRVRIEFVPPPGRFPPARESIVTPSYYAWKRRGVVQNVRVDLPNCCFPDYRPDGKPGMLHTVLPDHPIAKGLPLHFPVHQTEMYNEPFHIPEPDEVVFKETWEAGEWFRSGMVWKIGGGKVFYFRPGHEQYPVYKQDDVQQILLNAVRWMGADTQRPTAESRSHLLNKDNLVAWCIVPFDVKKRSPRERAEMLFRLGIKRAAYDWRAEHVASFEEEIFEYKKKGIEYFAFWDVHDRAFELFEKHNLHPQIWKTLSSPETGTQSEKVKVAAEAMLPLVKRTQELGSKLGLYNHGGWGGRPENLVAVCRFLREEHGANHVGIVYNFHHGHEDIDGFGETLRSMMPYLLCVNLNGMNRDADPKILPIGSGTHEQAMVATLVDEGYKGPIGILGHIATEDVEVTLGNNLAGLARLKKAL
ncbi:ThuA domain-containing protein [Verrucomicrobia bacterium]|nr:ThuA domain-containing protein [Verrucomicrobiota bacterium]MDA7866881.1 ThuA domain-containing protein [Verrucomicrobiota bacterium]